MGLFDKIFKPKEYEKALKNAQSTFKMLTTYKPVFTSWSGAIYENEMVRAAIDARARHISKLKVEIQGNAQPKLQTALKYAPNEFQTYSQFLYRISTILDCTNTCFIVPMLNNQMETIGYIPILPQNVEVLEYNGVPWLRFRFHNNQVGACEQSKCAILTRFQFKSDIFGDSQHALDSTMRVIHIQNEGVKEAVKESNTYRFMAKLTNFTNNKDGLKAERKRFVKENMQDDTGGLILFPNTFDNIQQIKSQPYTVDADQMNYIRDNVNRYFGVNSEIMENIASAEKMDAFFNGVVEPFAIQFSEAMTKCMFTEREQAAGAKLIANANRLQYMSTTSKVQMAKELGDRGAMTINEIRELFNYEPLSDGDVAMIRGEYYPVQQKIQEGNTENEEQ